MTPQLTRIDNEGLGAAERMANSLAELLAARYNIPVVTNVDTDAIVLSLYAGLTVRVDGTWVCWREPDPHRRRPYRRCMAYRTLDRAAHRLADHYQLLIQIPLRELLAGGIAPGRDRSGLDAPVNDQAAPC